MAVQTTKTNKPLNPRGQDQSPKGYNRAELYTGKALDFDGANDELSVSSITDIYKSFCFYFNSDNKITSTSSMKRLFGIYEQYFGISTGSSTGSVTDESLTFMPNGGGRFGTKMDFESNTWYHVAVVAKESDNTYLMYINAQDKTDFSINAHTPTAATDLKLAAANNGGPRFDGEMANFKAFNTALTAAQVADLYNNPEKIVPTGVSNDALKLWLPMQEGAGTTAYDGSGNGNHGTISGATYTHGIGAPVAQTAVIDWNKGSNIVVYSEKLDEWTLSALSVVQSSATAPDGSTNAYTLTDNSFSSYGICFPSSTISMSGDYVGSVFIKKTTGSISNYPGLDIAQRGTYLIIDTTNGTSVESGSGTNYSDVTITSHNDDWWRVSAKINHTSTARPIRFWPAISSNGTSISASATGSATFWGAQVEAADSLGAYVRTGATAQTSEVLLPAGLTTGRDITGVNLFENVRKQGALNLDGNSWAEVHDNESLDMGTGSFTLEAWVKVAYQSIGSSINCIMSLGGSITDANTTGLAMSNNFVPSIWYKTNATTTTAQNEGDWIHMIGTYDETNVKLYLNGAEVKVNARTAADITNALTKYVGRDGGSSRHYSDQIAQPRIYNRALTAEEVQRSYDSGKNTFTND